MLAKSAPVAEQQRVPHVYSPDTFDRMSNPARLDLRRACPTHYPDPIVDAGNVGLELAASCLVAGGSFDPHAGEICTRSW